MKLNNKSKILTLLLLTAVLIALVYFFFKDEIRNRVLIATLYHDSGGDHSYDWVVYCGILLVFVLVILTMIRLLVHLFKKNTLTIKLNNPRKLAVSILILLIIALSILGGLGSGKLQFGFAYIRCGGAPIAGSLFGLSSKYLLPTDTGYETSAFSKYYCSEAEAVKNGLQPSILSEDHKKKAEELRKQREEDKRFSPEKIKYTLYVPGKPYTYGTVQLSKMFSEDVPHSFFNVKEDGYNIAAVREGLRPSEYELCDSKQDKCTSLGKDKKGRNIVTRVLDKKIKSRNATISYSVDIGKTFVVITGKSEELSIDKVISIFSSLEEYKNESK